MILKHCETICFSGNEYWKRTRGIESRPRGDSYKVCAQYRNALKFIYKVHEMSIMLWFELLKVYLCMFEVAINI